MASKMKAPVIGNVFSSDSSEDERPRRSIGTGTEASDSDRTRKVSIKLNLTDSDLGASSVKSQVPPDTSNAYAPIDKNRIAKLKHNTMIQYETNAGKLIKSKYFKSYDLIAGTITVGFYPHNKKNYSQAISGIKSISVSKTVSGGAGALQGTIEVANDKWKTIRRDMIISYEKEDHEFVYRAKFNSFIKSQDGSTKMSLTSERGFNYIANPAKIIKIYRHLSSNDKTLTYILESLQKLETRVKQLESKKNK